MFVSITAYKDKKIKNWYGYIVDIITPNAKPTKERMATVLTEPGALEPCTNSRIIFKDTAGNCHLLTLSYQTILTCIPVCPVCGAYIKNKEGK